ncbi:uncharacterized protein LOC106069173 [Biomphalaria glabrata]|uniref:Uncharacterized protein LOC106069173 n=1 Tax=Biomphalaria glabrata TaxID=6526 RepID=A0A9U8EEG7_BIOGL|nr:uncharacterized protein LOC106069173 [Biomphalaria glabrata]XP_013084234.2 uncharacterized protein LOC106069173 [Biomphalaria glabrata]XP_013084235.2 uncharacterized protein LOC106069173 [Biomphalaria glabrata]
MAERPQQADKQTAQQQHSPQPSASLTIVVPNGRQKDMHRILKPFLKSVECLETYLHIQEADSVAHLLGKTSSHVVPHYSVQGDEMSSPSLAVIVFLPEFGPKSVDNVRQKFRKLPWRHHHTIQLQKAGSSNVLGKHEFYSLSRQLPLWSVGISPHNVGYVRFNLFVRRFNAMVEFYRLITGTEMESRKPGFSMFSIGKFRPCENASTHQTVCELVLKHCPQVSPYPLKDAFLTFPVHNLQSLLAILPSRPQMTAPNNYLVHDPDGNALLLYESDLALPQQTLTLPSVVPNVCQGLTQPADKASVHSDSIDSGRYSDFDAYSGELDQCMSRLAAVCRLDANEGTHLTPLELPAARPSVQLLNRAYQTKCDIHPTMTYQTRPLPAFTTSQRPIKHVSHDLIGSDSKLKTHSSDHRSNPCDHIKVSDRSRATPESQADLSWLAVPTVEDAASLIQFTEPASETCVPRSKFIADLRDYGYLTSVPTKTTDVKSIHRVYDATFI